MGKMESDGFVSSDFTDYGMNAEQKREHHMELPARFKDAVTIEVGSSTGVGWYEVLHDFSSALSCTCPWASFHRNVCNKHMPRAQAVLDQRQAREKAARRLTHSSLNGNKPFSLT